MRSDNDMKNQIEASIPSLVSMSKLRKIKT